MGKMDFTKIIRDGRIKRGLSQKQLADEVGVTKRAIAYWKKGTRQMSIENADKVLKALHISIKLGDQSTSEGEVMK